MNQDLIERNETNRNSKGGTELLQNRLYDGSVPRELLEQFQIVFSRVRDLDENKFRIYYAHDLAGDPEADKALLNDGWKRFHKLVFVSNWQMQSFIQRYQLPWSKCIVIPNSITPFAEDKMSRPYSDGTIRLVYTSTPHRGLNILYSVFDALSKKYDNIVLDVYSSFKLYGWGDRDQHYQRLFELMDKHPKINNFGTVSNEELRNGISQCQIFAYPSTWAETSCLCLIEAMSAGLLCVHPNYGALYETAANNTMMYQWDEDEQNHAQVFYGALDYAISTYGNDYMPLRLRSNAMIVNEQHSWERRSQDWIALLSMIVNQNPDKSLTNTKFTYNV